MREKWTRIQCAPGRDTVQLWAPVTRTGCAETTTCGSAEPTVSTVPDTVAVATVKSARAEPPTIGSPSGPVSSPVSRPGAADAVNSTGSIWPSTSVTVRPGGSNVQPG